MTTCATATVFHQAENGLYSSIEELSKGECKSISEFVSQTFYVKVCKRQYDISFYERPFQKTKLRIKWKFNVERRQQYSQLPLSDVTCVDTCVDTCVVSIKSFCRWEEEERDHPGFHNPASIHNPQSSRITMFTFFVILPFSTYN